MRISVVTIGLSLVLLVACGRDATTSGVQTADTTTEPTSAAASEPDYIGPTGTRIRFADDAPRYFTPEDCERPYRQVSQCMNVDVPGPVVLVVRHPIVVDGREYSGYTDFTSGQITVVSCSVVAHEYVHYLLWASGTPNAQNAAHESETFARCGQEPTASSN